MKTLFCLFVLVLCGLTPDVARKQPDPPKKAVDLSGLSNWGYGGKCIIQENGELVGETMADRVYRPVVEPDQ